MPLDIEKYLSHVEDFDLTEEQKVELLRTIWAIMENFVDRAFGVDSVQQARGKLPENSSHQKDIGVKSNHHQIITAFDRATNTRARRKM